MVAQATRLPTNPRELGLPFDAWRPGQKETAEAVAASPKKFVVLQAPTGTGKSAIAIGAAKLLQGRTAILCRTKQLQAQYLDAYPAAVIAKGRNNFVCSRWPEFTADRAPCRYVSNADAIACSTDCGYKKQMQAATASNLLVANYPLYLAMHRFAGKAWQWFDTVVCDEAHLLEQEITRFASIYLSKATLRQQRLLDPHTELLWRWQQWGGYTAKMLRPVMDKLEQQVQDVVLAGDKPSHELMLDFGIIKSLQSTCKSLAAMDDSWVITDNKSHYLFTPAWVKGQAPYKFIHNRKVILMSATILDPKIFCELLGIEADEFDFIDMPAVFPKERRPIFYSPVAHLSFKNMDSELPKLVAAIDRILDSQLQHKGIIHAHNYRIAEYIYKNSKHRARMITHQGDSREAALEAFKAADAPATLISPSMTTGVSLDENYARYGIVAKIPFPDQSDKLVAKRLESGGRDKWYSYATAAELVQSTGRIVRSATDWGTNYILDSNYGWFAKSNPNLFPGWWLESVEVRR